MQLSIQGHHQFELRGQIQKCRFSTVFLSEGVLTSSSSLRLSLMQRSTSDPSSNSTCCRINSHRVGRVVVTTDLLVMMVGWACHTRPYLLLIN